MTGSEQDGSGCFQIVRTNSCPPPEHWLPIVVARITFQYNVIKHNRCLLAVRVGKPLSGRHGARPNHTPLPFHNY